MKMNDRNSNNRIINNNNNVNNGVQNPVVHNKEPYKEAYQEGNLVIVITAGKEESKDLVRLEKRRQTDCPKEFQFFEDGGLYSGVCVDKAGTQSAKVRKADVKTEFIAHLTNYDNPSTKTNVRENRGVYFWLMDSSVGDKDKLDICSEFMHHLLEPETFPLGKVGYIKKALWLLKLLKEMRRVELTFEGLPEEEPVVKEEAPLIENYITVMTPQFYDYQYLPEVPASKRSKIQFKVKSGGGACVALSHVYGDTDRQTYEVVLGDGGNRRSLIRYGGRGDVVAEKLTPNLLNSNEFVYFWIDWSGASVRVGRGEKVGENCFLSWEKIPQQRRHVVNLISVSGSAASIAQWEFIEYIRPYTVANESKGAKRKRVRKAVTWYAKQKKMLEQLEEAFPASLHTAALLKQCSLGFGAMLESVMFLKNVVDRGLVIESSKGVWTRLHKYNDDVNHDLKLVNKLPRFSSNPTVLILTSLYCEKMAVDHVFDDTPVSYFLPDGNVLVTVGRIGTCQAVVTKFPNFSTIEGSTEQHASYITKILDLLPHPQHVFLLGVGGGVPHFTSFEGHVQRGDVVVSSPRKSDGATYVHCPKVDEDPADRAHTFYPTLTLNDSDDVIAKRVGDVIGAGNRAGGLRLWERHAEKALVSLGARDERFFRPPAKSDVLKRLLSDGTVETAQHPTPRDKNLLNKCRVKSGAIGSGRAVSRHPYHRTNFAALNYVIAYDSGLDLAVGALSRESHRYEGLTIVLGVADYLDGSVGKTWQPYASLMAAAVVKALLL